MFRKGLNFRVSDVDADANTDVMDAIDFAGRERGRV